MNPTDRAIPDGLSTAVVSLVQQKEPYNGIHLLQDTRPGIVQALSYLAEQGHGCVGYVGEPFTEAKKQILCEELTKVGLTTRPEWIITARTSFDEAGREGVRHLLSCSERPTAIFSAYGYITQGILKELNAQGVHVPQDLSVISMDNEPFPLDPYIDIACIPSDIEHRCMMAMELLEERMFTEQPNTSRHIVLPTAFHIGQSIAPPPQQK